MCFNVLAFDAPHETGKLYMCIGEFLKFIYSFFNAKFDQSSYDVLWPRNLLVTEFGIMLGTGAMVCRFLGSKWRVKWQFYLDLVGGTGIRACFVESLLSWPNGLRIATTPSSLCHCRNSWKAFIQSLESHSKARKLSSALAQIHAGRPRRPIHPRRSDDEPG